MKEVETNQWNWHADNECQSKAVILIIQKQVGSEKTSTDLCPHDVGETEKLKTIGKSFSEGSVFKRPKEVYQRKF